MSKVLKDKRVLAIGGAALVAVLAAWQLGISPTNEQIEEARDQTWDLQARNEITAMEIPRLRAQLETIAPQVDDLRELASQVPPQLVMPDLYSDLNDVATSAGLDGVNDVQVTVPEVLEVDTSSPEPSNGEESDDQQAGGQTQAVLASYRVTMQLSASPGQTADFLSELNEADRLAVVTSTNVGPDRSTISANFYLQQVDVEDIAAQIEELAESTTPGARPGNGGDQDDDEAEDAEDAQGSGN